MSHRRTEKCNETEFEIILSLVESNMKDKVTSKQRTSAENDFEVTGQNAGYTFDSSTYTQGLKQFKCKFQSIAIITMQLMLIVNEQLLDNCNYNCCFFHSDKAK